MATAIAVCALRKKWRSYNAGDQLQRALEAIQGKTTVTQLCHGTSLHSNNQYLYVFFTADTDADAKRLAVEFKEAGGDDILLTDIIFPVDLES